MKKLFFSLTTAIMTLTACSLAAASDTQRLDDYTFNQDRMIIHNAGIYVVSSFDNADHLSCYSGDGQRLWNTKFSAKIISWDIMNNAVIVFSKSRTGHATYITCIDSLSGELIWQKP